MKKLLGLILAVMLLAVSAGYVFAEPTYTRGSDTRIKVETITPSTAHINNTLSSTITAGMQIIGFKVTDSAAGWGVIFDSASTTATTIIDESQVPAGEISVTTLPFPYKVVNGVVTAMKSATTGMTIYYLE